VRRSREEAARTRQSAVKAASRLFRQRGIEAVGVDEVMATLGMTAGGFYRHFPSKQALAAEACADAFGDSGLLQSRSARALLRRYLSEEHRDAAAFGCPMPALTSDMARQPVAVRRAFTRGVRASAARVAQLAPGRNSLALLAGVVGALALSRAVKDRELSLAILRDSRRFWLKDLGRGRPRTLTKKHRKGLPDVL
jgi:TetR/AcrR family transcriptional repressor of nem operon